MMAGILPCRACKQNIAHLPKIYVGEGDFPGYYCPGFCHEGYVYFLDRVNSLRLFPVKHFYSNEVRREYVNNGQQQRLPRWEYCAFPNLRWEQIEQLLLPLGINPAHAITGDYAGDGQFCECCGLIPAIDNGWYYHDGKPYCSIECHQNTIKLEELFEWWDGFRDIRRKNAASFM
jgi:hypothetical protein